MNEVYKTLKIFILSICMLFVNINVSNSQELIEQTGNIFDLIGEANRVEEPEDPEEAEVYKFKSDSGDISRYKGSQGVGTFGGYNQSYIDTEGDSMDSYYRAKAQDDEGSREEYKNPYESFYAEILEVLERGTLNKNDNAQSLATDTNNLKTIDIQLDTLVSEIAREQCLKQADENQEHEIITEAASRMSDTIGGLASDLESFDGQHKGSGNPGYKGGGDYNLTRMDSGAVSQSTEASEKKKNKWIDLNECLLNTSKALKSLLLEMSDYFLEYNYNTKMESKKKAFLNYVDKVTDLHKSLKDIFECADTNNSDDKSKCSQSMKDSVMEINGVMAYCFPDGLCIDKNYKLIEQARGIDKPTKTEYESLINGAIKTWVDYAAASSMDPISSAVMAKLLTYLQSKYTSNNQNNQDNSSDFVIDLQNLINYNIDAAFSCIKVKFIKTKTLLSQSTVSFDEDRLNDVIDCLNKTILVDNEGNSVDTIDLDFIIDNYRSISELEARKNKMSGSLVKGMKRADYITNIYDLYIRPIYYAMQDEGLTYSASNYDIFRSLVKSLFIVYDDFINNMSVLSSTKLAELSHRSARNYISIANREALGWKKREIMRKLENSSIEDAVASKRVEYDITQYIK
jgi:hypothetical protein